MQRAFPYSEHNARCEASALGFRRSVYNVGGIDLVAKEVLAVSAVGNPILVVVLSLVAGLLVGGVWSSYQRGAPRAVTAVLALLAVMALLFAALMLLEVM